MVVSVGALPLDPALPPLFPVMHLLLLMSLAASCLLQSGLSMFGDSSGEGGGRTAHQDSACPQGRTSPHRRRLKRAATSSTSSKVATFSTPCTTPLGQGAATRRRSFCSYVGSRRYLPAYIFFSTTTSRTTISSSHSNCLIQPRRAPLSTLTTDRSSGIRCSWSKFAALGLVDPSNGGDGGHEKELFRDDRSRIDPTAQQARRRKRPSMETDADDTPKLQRREGGEAGRGVVRNTSGRGGRAPRGAGVRTVATAAPNSRKTPVVAAGSGAGSGGGINQDDPLVKAWNSAKVLNPSRDQFPLGSGQRQRQRGGADYEQDRIGLDGRRRASPQRTDVRGGGGHVATGRGGGRGGRSRGRQATPAGMYVGDDKIPWYIKEVQDKGLDTEGSFDQWWKNNLDPETILVSIKEMKVEELKAQLASMELPTTGLKAELAERLAEGLVRFSLSDDNFQHAEVVDTTSNDSELPNCFPQVYENLSENELEQLRRDSRRRTKT